MKQKAEKHLEIALGGNMNISTLTPLALIEIMTDFAKKQVEAIDYTRCCTELKASKEEKTLELENELKELTEYLEFEMDIPKVHKMGMLILKEKIKLLKSL